MMDKWPGEIADVKLWLTKCVDGQARADMLQEKLDGFNFNKKKKLRPTLSNESLTQATQSIVAASPVPESSVLAIPSVSQSIVAAASVSDKPAAAAGTLLKITLHFCDALL